ncbi:MAG: hypothetical protein WD557_16510 [Dehalococcoidia bacterium]
MARWSEFDAQAPAMAERGRALIYQYGEPGGYLATIGGDGFPHIQPVRLRVADGAIAVTTREQPAAHLRTDPRYAYHAEGPDDRDDEFYIAGDAIAGADEFELTIQRALLATYKPHKEGNTWPPKYDRWRDPTFRSGTRPTTSRGPVTTAGVPWEVLAAAEPHGAEIARKQIRFVGIGLGYLATVRADGAPRIHPFCPTFSGDRLYGLILGESPKCQDLLRDPRCAVHACLFPPSPNEVLLTCVAIHHDDHALAGQVRASAAADGMTSTNDETLFEFHVVGLDVIEHGDGDRRTSWRASGAVGAR